MSLSIVLRLPHDMHPCRSAENAPRLPSFLYLLQGSHVLLSFGKVHNPWRLPPKLHRQKWSVHVVLCHKGVHFFDISTSKSGPYMWCFVHFDLETCFGNVLRATTSCTFSTSQLPKVVRTCSALYILTWKCASETCFRATTSCTFSTFQLPKVVRTCGALCILTWERASRHKGVQFCMSHLTTWLRARRFSELTFQPSGATNHWKNTVKRDFHTFSCTCIFFLRSLSLLASSHCFSSPL